MRSQLFITDLVFTASVFAIVFFTLALTINESIVNNRLGFDSMKARLYCEQIAALLTLNPGVPVNWHEGGMLYPGAVDSRNELNFDKMDALMAMDLNVTFQIPHPTSLMLEEITASGYNIVNCSQYLFNKYGNCSYFDEQRASRLLYSGNRVFRLQVIIDG